MKGKFEMANELVNGIISTFGGITNIPFGKELLVFIISILPILELRGGLIAAALLGLNPVSSYIISIIGNLIPVPFILLLMNKILDKIKIFNKFACFLDKKVEKNKEKIEKFGYWGIILFVGIPLPGTGAWTGSMIASVLELNKKKTFGAVIIGIFMASIIMMLLSFGILANIIK